jgi:hypothetical protein
MAADEELLWRVVSETFLTQPATVAPVPLRAVHLPPCEQEYSQLSGCASKQPVFLNKLFCLKQNCLFVQSCSNFVGRNYVFKNQF